MSPPPPGGGGASSYHGATAAASEQRAADTISNHDGPAPRTWAPANHSTASEGSVAAAPLHLQPAECRCAALCVGVRRCVSVCGAAEPHQVTPLRRPSGWTTRGWFLRRVLQEEPQLDYAVCRVATETVERGS